MTPPPKAPAMAAWGFEYLCANTPSSRRRVDGVQVMIYAPRVAVEAELDALRGAASNANVKVHLFRHVGF